MVSSITLVAYPLLTDNQNFEFPTNGHENGRKRHPQNRKSGDDRAIWLLWGSGIVVGALLSTT